jgi:anti-sigma factor RsiW
MIEHIAHATLVDYWADDLAADAQDAVELHLMGCAACTELSARVAALAHAFRDAIPPVISREALDKLRARGLRIVENPMRPSQRKDVTFPASADLILHRLTGLAGDTARVDFTLRCESTGEVLVEVAGAPFDAEAGAVLVACQKHYAVLPHDTVAEVRAQSARGRQSVTEYVILHHYE